MENITQGILPGLQPAGTGSVLLTSGNVPLGALSPQEYSQYSTLFKIALGPKNLKSSTSIPASTAANFLKRSRLSKKQLHDIWCLADSENSGQLSPNAFFKACRLVAHAQTGHQVITEDLLSMEPQNLPDFDSGESENVWKLSDMEIQRYAELYTREGGSNKLDGTDARALLVRSGLTSSELCDIWDLGDVDKDGKLTFGEFLVVMQLVSKVRDGSAFVPSELPPTLKEYLSTKLPQQPITPQLGVVDPLVVSDDRPIADPVPKSVAGAFGTLPQISEPPQVIGESSMEFMASGSKIASKHYLNAIENESETRRRQYRHQARDGRSRLENLREEARKSELALVNSDNHVGRLQDEILSLKTQISEAENELEEFKREVGASAHDADVVQAVAQVRELLEKDEREILELRSQLERLQREKIDLQSTLAILAEKKRQADQDRNLLIVGLESDRSKLVSVRAERLKLWEQRHELTRELTTKAFDQIVSNKSGSTVAATMGIIPSTTSGRQIQSQPSSSRDRKGVKADFASVSPDRLATAWSSFGQPPNLSDPLAGAFATSQNASPGSPMFGSR
jgi:predicted  nucleic acid-binding Zn-ribbon protein